MFSVIYDWVGTKNMQKNLDVSFTCHIFSFEMHQQWTQYSLYFWLILALLIERSVENTYNYENPLKKVYFVLLVIVT